MGPPSETGDNREVNSPSSPASYVIVPETGRFTLSGQPATLEVSIGVQFIPGRPYCEMVTAFLAATAGLTPVFDDVNYPNFLSGVSGRYPGIRVPTVSLDLFDLTQRIRAGAITSGQTVEMLCCMLANTAWEASKDHWGRHQHDPDVEFFRHVRHAASHGNKWHFNATEPKRHAEWMGCRIDGDVGNANARQGKKCIGTDLAVSDLLKLLADLETKLP
jgi:hypothetical protein